MSCKNELNKLEKQTLLLKKKAFRRKLKLLKELKLKKQEQIIRREKERLYKEEDAIKRRIAQAKRLTPDEESRRKAKAERIRRVRQDFVKGAKATGAGAKTVLHGFDKTLGAIFGHPPKRKKK